MNGTFVKLSLASLLVIGSIAGCQASKTSTTEESNEIPVEVAEIMSGSLDGTKTLSGIAKANESYSLTPGATAEITKVHVEKGDNVSEGDVLVELDRTHLEFAVKQEKAALARAESGYESAQANHERAQANHDQAREGVVSAKNGVAQAKSQLKQAQANLDEAKVSQQHSIDNAKLNVTNAKNQLEAAERERDRSQRLYDAGMITLQELEQARDSVKQAQVNYEQAQSALKQAQEKVSLASLEAAVEQAELGVVNAEQTVKDAELAVKSAKIGVDEARSRLKDADGAREQARLAVEQAEEQLNDAVIKAPAAGEIIDVAGQVGELATQQTPLIEMASLDLIKLEVQVTAEQLQLFEKDEDVSIDFVALDEPVTGKITFIASTTNDNGLFPVEATIENEDREIRPGMYGQLMVEEEYVPEGILVPSEGVIEKNGEDVVYIVKDETAVEVPVEILRSESDVTAVKGDLAPGDRIVVKGQYMLNDGDTVTIVAADVEIDEENNDSANENEVNEDEESSDSSASENEESEDEGTSDDETNESDDK